MKILLHVCCAPCTIYPLDRLRPDHEVCGYFLNPNIEPVTEYDLRAATLRNFAARAGFPVIWEREEKPAAMSRKEEMTGKDRCEPCYLYRLRETARLARVRGFEAFTSTLLFSRYQRHDLIAETGTRLGEEEDIPFFYRDFRGGWNEGLRASREMGLYRQSYCGCRESEKESLKRKEEKGRPGSVRG